MKRKFLSFGCGCLLVFAGLRVVSGTHDVSGLWTIESKDLHSGRHEVFTEYNLDGTIHHVFEDDYVDEDLDEGVTTGSATQSGETLYGYFEDEDEIHEFSGTVIGTQVSFTLTFPGDSIHTPSLVYIDTETIVQFEGSYVPESNIITGTYEITQERAYQEWWFYNEHGDVIRHYCVEDTDIFYSGIFTIRISRDTVVAWTAGQFVTGDGDWSPTGAVPIHVQVLDSEGNPVQGAAVLLEDIPYGQTDVDGRLDFSWPIPDSPPIEGAFSSKVKALWHNMSAESEPLMLYNAERLEARRTATLTAGEAFMYNLTRLLNLLVPTAPSPPGWAWDLFSIILAILEHHEQYDARAGDLVSVETYKYTAENVTPAWLIRQVILRDGEVLVERNSWTENELRYLEATSPIPPSLFLYRGGILAIIASPAALWVEAPDGSHAGYDPLTGELVSDFPIAISELGSEPFGIFIPQPTGGQYLFTVTGTDSGSYGVSLQATDSNGIRGQESTYNGFITPGQSHTYGFSYHHRRVIVANVANRISLSWQAFGNGLYTVQCTDDMLHGVWRDAPGTWPVTETSWTGHNITTIENRYYRVMSE